MAELSVIIPVRDRSGDRLANCLASLRWQTLESERFEIVIGDFGSTPSHTASIDALAERYDARVVRTTTDEPWSRSRALNSGITAALGPWTLATDVDMIFAPSFLATVVDALATPDRLVVCRCWDLPTGEPAGRVEADDYPQLLSRASMRPSGGTGACQATTTRWLRDVGGYDSRYVLWGFEDKDLVARAERGGLRLHWIHERTSMVHQWHPTPAGRRSLRKYRNKLRFWLTRFFVHKGAPLPGPKHPSP